MKEVTTWLIGILAFLALGSRSTDGQVYYELTVEECPELIKLNELQKKKQFTDIIIESTDGQQYEAHKAVLAAKSDKMRSLILEAEKNKPCTCEKTILRTKVKGDVLNTTLEYAYSGKIYTTNDTVSDLIKAASSLGFDKLTDTVVENFLSPAVTDETFVTMISTTTARPRKPVVEERFVEQVLTIEESDEQRLIQLTKKFDPKLIKKYLKESKLPPNKLVSVVSEWIDETKNDDTTEPEEIAQVIDELPYEGMNCSSLKKIADELTGSDPKLAEAAKEFLKHVMELSTSGKGECYSGCADCERLYQFETTMVYNPATAWNTTMITPQGILGKEFQLGKFKVGTTQFSAALQRPDRTDAPSVGLSGLMIKFLPPIGLKGSRLEKKEFDCELKITENGKEKDCPLRNRFRYKFDQQTDMYKWNTKMDTTKDHTISIKMSEIV